MENQENEGETNCRPRTPTPTALDSLITGMENLESPTRSSRVRPKKRQGSSMVVQNIPRPSYTTTEEEEPWDFCYATEAWIATQPFLPDDDDDEPMDHQSIANSSQNQVNGYMLYRPRMPKRLKIEYEDDPVNQGPPLSMIEALGIHIISEKIFGMVDKKDLKNCRLTSKLFNDVSTPTLEKQLKNEGFKLTFKYHWGYKKFVREYGEDLPITPEDYLETLNECLDMRYKGHQFNSFPCTNFAFELGVQNSNDLRTFFYLFGSKVKELSLTYEQLNDFMGYSQFEDLLILLNEIPNVESLNIPWYSYPDNPEIADILVAGHEQIPLQELKTLSLSCSAGFDRLLEKLLVAAPDLQVLINSCPHLLEILVRRGKTCLFREFEFSPNPSNLSVLQQFANTEPILRSIRINSLAIVQSKPTWRKVAEILNKILKSGRKSLEEIDLMPIGFLGAAFIFPTMDKVRSINFSGYAPGGPVTSPYFPKTMMISQSLPHLTSVKFDDAALDNLEQSLNVLFPLEWFQRRYSQRFHTVVNMELGRIPTPVVLQRLLDLFPNVRHLVVISTPNVERLESIWYTWMGLESIELNNVVFPYTFHPLLDVVITGVPEGVCSIFRRYPLEDLNPNVYRMGNSICNLKDLKLLKFHISYVHNWPSESPSNPFISRASGIFALSQMPQLRVIFEVSNNAEPVYTKRALEEALPFITIL